MPLSPCPSLVARSSVGAAAFAAVFTLAVDASADDPTREQCFAANESAQSLRQSGKFQPARAQLLTCIAPSCPSAVRTDCEERLNELEKAMPTIVFAAKGPDGSDVSAVKVTMDGAPLVERLDGVAVAVEPGEHSFEFTAEGYPTVSKKLVVREGVKGRAEAIRLGKEVHEGHLLILAGPHDEIEIDGTPRGVGQFRQSLPSGVHSLRVSASGMRPQQQEVTIEDGANRTVRVALEPESSGGGKTWLWIGGGVLLVAAAVVTTVVIVSNNRSETVLPPKPGTAGIIELALPRWVTR
jgi:hypothetical protein